jgi:alpha-glucosidase
MRVATAIPLAGLSGCATNADKSVGDQPDAGQAAPAPSIDDLAWWQKTVVYECYPKSFLDTAGAGTGTIAGVTRKLDHIARLGVGALWLTPIFVSPMKDNGYDVADDRSIDPSFGTMEDMDELIAEARARGIRIVLDLVLNHTSDEHAWFQESSSSRDNPKADWYIWRDAKPDGSAPTNWRGIFGGSAWTWNETRKQYYLHTFGDFQPDLNWECEELRAELANIARMWIDKGVGGFRMDAIPYIK